MGRTLTLSAITSIMLLIGLVGANGILLALTLPFIIALCVGVLYATEAFELEAERFLSTEKLMEGSTLSVRVKITNKGGNLPELHITDMLPPQLTVTQGQTSVITSLASGATIELKYELNGPRGAYSFPNLQVAVTDHLGLFWRRDQLDVIGKTESLIVPHVDTVGQITIRPRQTRSYAGYIPARVAGSGIDFFGVREYRQGDSLRHINWRANARHEGMLFSNEFEQERIADVGLILDARQRAVTRVGDEKLLEFEIAAATAFSESFINSGNRVSLLVYGNFLNWTLPGYGKVQRQRILQALSSATIGDSQVFDRLEYLPTSLFPAKSQIVIFSTILPDDATYLVRMRARGYAVMVISPDPIAYEASLLPETEAMLLGRRIAQIERELLLRKLRQAGVQVVNWNVSQPLEQLVKGRLNRPIFIPQGGILQ